jgi:hypothetical protein
MRRDADGQEATGAPPRGRTGRAVRRGVTATAAVAAVTALLAGCGSSGLAVGRSATSTTGLPATTAPATTGPATTTTPTAPNPFGAGTTTTSTTDPAAAAKPPSTAALRAEAVTAAELPHGWKSLPNTPSTKHTMHGKCGFPGATAFSHHPVGNDFVSFTGGKSEFAEAVYSYPKRRANATYRNLVTEQTTCPTAEIISSGGPVQPISFPALGVRSRAFEASTPVLGGTVRSVFVFAVLGDVVLTTVYSTYPTADVTGSLAFTRLALAKLQVAS